MIATLTRNKNSQKKKTQTLIPAPAWYKGPHANNPFTTALAFLAVLSRLSFPNSREEFRLPCRAVISIAASCFSVSFFFFLLLESRYFWFGTHRHRNVCLPLQGAERTGLAKLQNYLPRMEMHELHTCICRISCRPTAAILLQIQPQIWICHATPACTSSLISPSPTTALYYWRYKSATPPVHCTGNIGWRRVKTHRFGSGK
jgi:hypothetical protein